MHTGSVVRVTIGVRYFGSFAKRNAASNCFERVRDGRNAAIAYGIQHRTSHGMQHDPGRQWSSLPKALRRNHEPVRRQADV